MINKIQNRKEEHFNICLRRYVESKKKISCFEDIELIPRSFSNININNIELSTKIFNKYLSYPFIISSITGGFDKAIKINKNLALSAEKLNIGMGVGSQRIAIEKKQLDSFNVVRKYAPTALIYANIGISQIRDYDNEIIDKLISMVDADALSIHLNHVQELVQPEGKIKLFDSIEDFKELIKSINVPVFIKGTGFGISKEDVEILKNTGIKGIDVGGSGGTSWSAIEYYRSIKYKNNEKRRLGKLLWDFGIPTPLSILECRSSSIPIIATGGIRSGIDIAKSIALGASITSSALPFVKLSLYGEKHITNYILMLMNELKSIMFLTGNSSLKSLSKTPLIITGFTKEYINQRKLKSNKTFCRNI